MKQKKIAEVVERGLKKRRRRERRFRFMGIAAIATGLMILVLLFSSIAWSGIGAFQQTRIALDLHFDESVIDPNGSRSMETLSAANYAALVKKSLRTEFPSVKKRRAKRRLYALVSSGAAYQLREMVMQTPELIGQTKRIWVIADDDVDVYEKHFRGKADQTGVRLKEDQMRWLRQLREQGRVELRFNTTFFTAGDSREPELAGIRGALVGSILTLLVTLLLSFSVGVAAAIYLEEFAPRNRWTYLIEVNVNNLAAVPSIVFGLLGLAVFINFFGLPRSAPVVGGLVLTLMTLPTIIIAARAALKSVPP